MSAVCARLRERFRGVEVLSALGRRERIVNDGQVRPCLTMVLLTTERTASERSAVGVGLGDCKSGESARATKTSLNRE